MIRPYNIYFGIFRVWFFATLFLVLGIGSSFSQPVRLGFLNCYNLFDTVNQPGVFDGDFTPSGRYRWDLAKYSQKLSGLSSRISSMEVDLLGLCEVENRSVVEDLVDSLGLPWHIIHYESSDARGIDMAFVYDPARVSVLESGLIPFSTSRTRREALHCRVRIALEVYDLIFVHLPSRGGGRLAALDRLKILSALSQQILSSSDRSYILMGDFNETHLASVPPLVNLMGDLTRGGYGSHSYYGVWSMLDQVLVSPEIRDRVGAPQLHYNSHPLHRGKPSTSRKASDHAGITVTLSGEPREL